MIVTPRFRASTTHPETILQYLLAGNRTSAGVSVSEDTALRVSAVYACVRVIAESLSQLPLPVYRRVAKGKERLPKHPLARVLRKPNAWQTGYEFREMMTAHAVLRGNAYAQILRFGGQVSSLIPLNPAEMRVERGADGGLRYTYRAQQQGQQVYAQSEILHLRGLSSDGITGLSPIALQRESIGLAMAAEKLGAQMFGNGAKPNAGLKHPKQLSEEAFERLKASLDESYNGGNALRTIVLEEGLEWVKIGVDPKDAQFLETRKFQVEDIGRVFRVPPHKIGNLDKATFSNIEHQSQEFVSDTLMPWAARWEQALSLNLLPEKEQDEVFAEHLFDGLLRGDAVARAQYYQAALGTTQQPGWMTPNEVRAKENMNEMEGGNERTPLITEQRTAG